MHGTNCAGSTTRHRISVCCLARSSDIASERIRSTALSASASASPHSPLPPHPLHSRLLHVFACPPRPVVLPHTLAPGALTSPLCTLPLRHLTQPPPSTSSGTATAPRSLRSRFGFGSQRRPPPHHPPPPPPPPSEPLSHLMQVTSPLPSPPLLRQTAAPFVFDQPSHPAAPLPPLQPP
jgi:hypothetical protein